MNNLLGVDKTFALLENLKSTLRDFAAREEKLVQEHKSQAARARLRFGQAIEDEDARLAGEIEAVDARLQSQLEQCESRYEKRKGRIERASQTAKQRRIETIDNQEGRRRYEIQRERMDAEGDREENRKREEQQFAEFSAHWTQASATLTGLEMTSRVVFRGHKDYLRLLALPPQTAADDSSGDENAILDQLRAANNQLTADLDRIRKRLMPMVGKFVLIGFGLLLLLLLYFPLFEKLHGIGFLSLRETVTPLLLLLGIGIALHFIGKFSARSDAAQIASALGKARHLHMAGEEKSRTRHEQKLQHIQSEYDARSQRLDRQWKAATDEAAQKRQDCQRSIESKKLRVPARNETLRRITRERLQHQQAGEIARWKGESESRRRQMEAARATEEAKGISDDADRWQTLEVEWKDRIQPIFDAIVDARATAKKLFPEWQSSFCEDWSPPTQFTPGAQFGSVEVDLEKLAGTLPQDKRLAFPGPLRFQMPLLLTIPARGSILFETNGPERSHVVGALNNLVIRLLSTSAPGKAGFTIIDPVELGQNFAGLMHLADYEPSLINDRIWTQPGQIEQRLANLNERIEKITQMYLRNEFETVTQYNEQAGRNAEKYHFLLVANFPVNFSDLAAKRLLSIAASGARCGVYTLIHWDQRRPVPQDFVPGELRKSSLCIRSKGTACEIAGTSFEGVTVTLSPPPSPELATTLLQKIGQRSIDSNRVEIPFAEIVPDESKLWSGDTTAELRVPIGATGATKTQQLALGKGTRQHVLIAGKTGSGKSTLFHVLITNLALWCSPDQVEFYLVDFKKGVEFKCYATARLPHARVIAIESDREFGLSVLERVDGELKRRGDLFRKLGVQDLTGYKNAGGTEPLPRTLLIIDEFQEFFTEDDRIAQSAALLLDRIVRQGRAFGIHVLLGSQTLGGAYSLARATLGQMVVRVALQCNEADASLIMDDANPAPRLLSRPGEAIYNDSAGTIEGNSPFQIVWLPNDVREVHLEKIRQLANRASTDYPDPIVFEGNAPANVADNNELRRSLAANSIQSPLAPRVWLGAPNSIKGPTEAIFHRQSGHNLLLVGQRDEAILAMMGISLLSLAAQYPRGATRFIFLDCSPQGSEPRLFLEKIIQAIPHEVTLPKPTEIGDLLTDLVNELDKRSDPQTAAAPSTYLFIHRLQSFKSLRYEEDFGFSSDEKKTVPPGNQLDKLICEAANVGIHVLCSCDTANNLNRSLSRKALSEFEMRVLFQMSANDSASLIDTPKANDLGLHRAIFFNGHEGYLETFRPYALPSNDWIETAAKNLTRLLK